MDRSFTDYLKIGGVPVTIEYSARFKHYTVKIPDHGPFHHYFWFGRKNGRKVHEMLKVLESKVPSQKISQEDDESAKRARLMKWAVENIIRKEG